MKKGSVYTEERKKLDGWSLSLLLGGQVEARRGVPSLPAVWSKLGTRK